MHIKLFSRWHKEEEKKKWRRHIEMNKVACMYSFHWCRRDKSALFVHWRWTFINIRAISIHFHLQWTFLWIHFFFVVAFVIFYNKLGFYLLFAIRLCMHSLNQEEKSDAHFWMTNLYFFSLSLFHSVLTVFKGSISYMMLYQIIGKKNDNTPRSKPHIMELK